MVAGVGLLLLDLLSKWLAQEYFTAPIEIWPGVFKFSLSHNTGVAFSIPIPNAFMIWLAPLLLGILIYSMSRVIDFRYSHAKLCLMFIMAGGLGNLINRLWTGSVTDFLDFSFWPSFNLADSYLTLGAFLLIIFYGKITLKKSTAYGSK